MHLFHDLSPDNALHPAITHVVTTVESCVLNVIGIHVKLLKLHDCVIGPNSVWQD